MNYSTCTYQKYITAEIEKHFMCESAFFWTPCISSCSGSSPSSSSCPRPSLAASTSLNTPHIPNPYYPPLCLQGRQQSKARPKYRSGAWSGPNLSMFTVKKMATSPIYFLPRVSKLPIVKLFPHNRVRGKNSQLM